MVAEGARFVVIGGFAVIANRFVRATEDVDFLVPDDPANDRRVLAALRDLDGRGVPYRRPAQHRRLQAPRWGDLATATT
ncbi:MAG TPA: hypothetical protein VFI03_08645 [Solirubrobacterales bacterium]|nr:hypothetical protein [Solirubrobacterales bacterium]